MATVQYDDLVNIERLPVDAQDVATRVDIVIVGNRAGPHPRTLINFLSGGTFPTIDEAVTYVPRPLVYRYVADSDIQAEARADLPEGFNPFLPPEHEDVPEPTSVGSFTNPGSPSAIRDGDASTYAAGSGTIEYAGVAKAVGFRLLYTASEGGQAAIILHPNVLPVTTWVIYDLPATSSPAEVYVVVPLDARTAAENQDGGVVIPPAAPYGTLVGAPRSTNVAVSFTSGSAQVFEFYPLIPNETLLDAVAQQNIKLPASDPKRITVAGYVAPDRTHTIVGWPGGDYTGVVAQVQYELGRTVIDFEQAGAPVGLPAEAIEAARERRVAIDRAVQDATYPVRMGERQ